MNTLIQLFHQYPFLFGGVTVTGAKYVADVFISSLESPTKDSSASYRYWFKVLNKFAANWYRAADTSIERSPNFQDAVQKHLAENIPPPQVPPAQ